MKSTSRIDGIKLVRKHFPNISRNEAGFILWNCTGWPWYYTGNPHVYFNNQIKRFKRAVDLNRLICDMCGRMRFPSQIKSGTCMKCLRGL